MTIVSDENLVGIWFVAFKGRDVMAGLSRTAQPNEYRLIYRVRHYSIPESGPWDGKDRKSWQGGTVSCQSDDEAIHRTRTWITTMGVLLNGEEMHELLRGNLTEEEFTAKLVAMPFASSRQMSAEEFEREYGKDKP